MEKKVGGASIRGLFRFVFYFMAIGRKLYCNVKFANVHYEEHYTSFIFTLMAIFKYIIRIINLYRHTLQYIEDVLIIFLMLNLGQYRMQIIHKDSRHFYALQTIKLYHAGRVTLRLLAVFWEDHQ